MDLCSCKILHVESPEWSTVNLTQDAGRRRQPGRLNFLYSSLLFSVSTPLMVAKGRQNRHSEAVSNMTLSCICDRESGWPKSSRLKSTSLERGQPKRAYLYILLWPNLEDLLAIWWRIWLVSWRLNYQAAVFRLYLTRSRITRFLYVNDRRYRVKIDCAFTLI